MHHGDIRFLRMTPAEMIPGNVDLDEWFRGLQERIRAMGYEPQEVEGGVHPPNDVALVFKGRGDREGEFLLCHICATDGGAVYMHKLPNREALEARKRVIRALAQTVREERLKLRGFLEEGGRVVGFAFEPPPPIHNHAKRRRLARRVR